MLKSLLLVALLGLYANPITSCDTDRFSINEADDSPAGILKMLREGEKQIRLEEKDRDMIALMGITGAGKTTFALYIGGYDDDLMSVETGPSSGEFIIEDSHKRSSSASATLESCTLIPAPFTDFRTKKTLIDMPGFSDTRPSVIYDIAATYFMKKVLDYARRVKLVFLVNHSHVKVGEDRGRFTELVAHITTLIRHIPKFEEGIALVATKVVNLYRPGSSPHDPYVPDDNVITTIADFLKDAKSFYVKHNQTKAAQLMDILLSKKKDRFSRIGIFRKPDGPGPLKNVTILQKNKHKLETLIESNLRFIEKNDADFGYTLSEKSKNTLHKMKEEMLKNMSTLISALGSRIEVHFNNRQASATELETLVSIFNDSSLDVSAFKKIAHFADYLYEYTKDLGVNITPMDLEVIRDAERHLDFLTYISGEAAIDWSVTIWEGMKKTVEYLQCSRMWYVLFLGTLYDQFSGYEIQKSRFRYDVSSLSKQISRIQSGTAKKVTIAELDTLKTLLKRVGNQHLLRIFASMEEADITKRHLHFLQVLLDATLGHPRTIILCQENTLIAEGHYVLVSQVLDKLHSCHKQQIHQMEIFALHKVFIDTNVNFTGKGVHQFTIVAPIWDVIGRVEISLNGVAGHPYERSAPNGDHWSEDGHDGKPGASGSSAGHFVGIGMNFINGEQLTISAVGGNGGNGQKGGHGRRGEDFQEARKYNGDANVNWDTIWPGHQYEQTLISEPGFFQSALYYVFITSKEYVYRVEVHSVQPSQGARGGNGGNGGKGGAGGYRGSIILMNLNSYQNESVKCITENGNNGEGGEGGTGGKGGQTGRVLIELHSRTKSLFGHEKSKLNFDQYLPEVDNFIRNGRNGCNGGNDADMERPTAVPFKKPYNIINEYKVFIQKYFNDVSHAFQTSALKNFLDKLDNNAGLASL